MELKEFKGRLEKQGVSYDRFCARQGSNKSVVRLVSRMKSFKGIIDNAFQWDTALEGVEFWDDVAWERNEEKCSLGRIVTPTTRELDYSVNKEPKGMSVEEFFTFFEETTARMIKISRAKNSDYTGSVDNDPFANFTRVEGLGICSTETGFLTRMTDKLCRIASFVKQGNLKVKDESVQDTLLDLANYSILMLAYLESKK